MIAHVTESSGKLRTESCALELEIRKWLVNLGTGISVIQGTIMQIIYIYVVSAALSKHPIMFDRILGCERGRHEALLKNWRLGGLFRSPC